MQYKKLETTYILFQPSTKHYFLKFRPVLGFPVHFQKGCQPIMPKLLRFRPFCFLKQKHWAAIW